jgi:hypothetical protein
MHPTQELAIQLEDAFEKLRDLPDCLEPLDEDLDLKLRLAASLCRNAFMSFYKNDSHDLFHIAVIGGAGTGKSTIVNFLVGTEVADRNPQAGYTRHPIGYTASDHRPDKQFHNGRLGPLTLLTRPTAPNLDEDVCQIRDLSSAAADKDFLRNIVVWDCPDITTDLSRHYIQRVIEPVSLADLVVYAASDERYNDLIPSRFLALLLQAGKPTLCCLTKLAREDILTITTAFRNQVLAALPSNHLILNVAVLPFIPPTALADPTGAGNSYRQALLDCLRPWQQQAARHRQEAAQRALAFLHQVTQELHPRVESATSLLTDWEGLLRRPGENFRTGYLRHKLSDPVLAEHFDNAFVKLIALLDWPGHASVLNLPFKAIRYPWAWIKTLVVRTPQTIPRMEEQILRDLWHDWRNELLATLGQFSAENPFWRHLHQELNQPSVQSKLESQFSRCLKELASATDAETSRIAHAIHQDVANHPVLLNSLRSLKFGAEVATVATVLWVGGLGAETLLIFLLTPIIQEITEYFGKQYIEMHKKTAALRKQELVTNIVVDSLMGVLTSDAIKTVADLRRYTDSFRQITNTLPTFRALVEAEIRAAHTPVGHST